MPIGTKHYFGEVKKVPKESRKITKFLCSKDVSVGPFGCCAKQLSTPQLLFAGCVFTEENSLHFQHVNDLFVLGKYRNIWIIGKQNWYSNNHISLIFLLRTCAGRKKNKGIKTMIRSLTVQHFLKIFKITWRRLVIRKEF